MMHHARVLLRFLRNRKANVTIIFALALVPLVFLTGMGVDYTSAVDRKQQLDADADAAALAAVTPAAMAGNDAASTTAATNTFNAQANAVYGIGYNANANLAVNVNDSLTTRTVTVTYTATSQNAFPNVLGQGNIPITGTSQAIGTLPPNIDFYLLLDDSPSMAIAATPAGITTMVNNTASQNGCAFGCHETNPGADNLGNPNGEDNYALARNLGVTLRVDLVRQAAQNLTTTATQTEAATHSVYRMAIYTFDVTSNIVGALTSNLPSISAQAGNINVLQVYSNNNLSQGHPNSDEDTVFDGAMRSLNAAMPAPGNGTNANGDKPQEVLFLVTDGVQDANVGGTRTYQVSTAWCDTIKNRGIRIAVLYTSYLPLPTNNWYNTYVAPIQSNIPPTMQTCASPGLYYEVQSGGDISAALNALFQKAVQTAHLTQ